MKHLAFLLSLTACHHIDPTPKLTCGEDGDTLEFTLTEQVNQGDCANYVFPDYPQELTFPLPQLAGCSPQVQPVSCELNGSQTCDYDGGLTYTTNWIGVELVEGGSGVYTATIAGASGVVCYLEYGVGVGEL